jgi:hypothetical protein
MMFLLRNSISDDVWRPAAATRHGRAPLAMNFGYAKLQTAVQTG